MNKVSLESEYEVWCVTVFDFIIFFLASDCLTKEKLKLLVAQIKIIPGMYLVDYTLSVLYLKCLGPDTVQFLESFYILEYLRRSLPIGHVYSKNSKI